MYKTRAWWVFSSNKDLSRIWENIESNLTTYLISGYCGILWGPTQGITTDTFEVSSDATSKTVNSFMRESCHLDRPSNFEVFIYFFVFCWIEKKDESPNLF